MKFPIFATVISASGAAALGINCRGSAYCGGSGDKDKVMGKLQEYVSGIQDARVYNNGEHIACTTLGISTYGGYCAFLQSTNRQVFGSNIKSLLDEIAKHGCTTCGSVPIDFPASNDPKNGILTVNFVSNTDNPCGDKLC